MVMKLKRRRENIFTKKKQPSYSFRFLVLMALFSAVTAYAYGEQVLAVLQ